MGKTSLLLVSANITTYGPTALGFLKEQSGVDVFAFQEIHLLAGDVPVARKKIDTLELSSYWTAAKATGKGGSSGGTMIAASHRVLPTHLNQNLDTGDSDDLQLHDMTAVVCSLQGLRFFLLVSVYMTVGAGLNSSVNDGKLQPLAGLIAAYGLPWVAVGDWNCGPCMWSSMPGQCIIMQWFSHLAQSPAPPVSRVICWTLWCVIGRWCRGSRWTCSTMFPGSLTWH